jgi:hypothetical protein
MKKYQNISKVDVIIIMFKAISQCRGFPKLQFYIKLPSHWTDYHSCGLECNVLPSQFTGNMPISYCNQCDNRKIVS